MIELGFYCTIGHPVNNLFSFIQKEPTFVSQSNRSVDPLSTGQMTGVYAALLAVQLFFGINYYASKVVLSEIPPQAWAGIRVTSAAVILLLIHSLFVRRYPAREDLRWFVGFALFGIVINQILFVEGLSRTSPTHSAIIGTTIPVMTLIMAALRREERLRLLKILGVILSLSGVCWLLGIHRFQFESQQQFGDVLTFLNCASFAFFLVLSRKVVAKYDALTSTTLLMVFGAIGVDIICAKPLFLFFSTQASKVSTSTWWHVAYVIIFPTILTYGLNYWALKRVDASLVAVFIYIQPVVAASLSVLFLGETITVKLVGSTVLVFTGVLLTMQQTQQWVSRLSLAFRNEAEGFSDTEAGEHSKNPSFSA